MNRLKRPDVWFLLAVGLLAVGGALLLHSRACLDLTERDWRWFTKQYTWRTAFDALSATCGVGLLACELNEYYTPTGRWLLTGLGLAGASLYLAASVAALRRLQRTNGQKPAWPPIWLVLAVFWALVAVSVPLAGGLERLVTSPSDWATPPDWHGSAWRALAAVGSLGWLPGAPPSATMWIYAALGLVGGLGWMVWLLPLGGGQRSGVKTLLLAGGYVAWLLLLAGLIHTFEAPRGARTAAVVHAAQPPPEREVSYTQRVAQTISAATAGISTQDLAGRSATEGTRAVLAGAVLVGGLGGGPGGGIQWLLLVWALTGGVAALTGGLSRRRDGEAGLPGVPTHTPLPSGERAGGGSEPVASDPLPTLPLRGGEVLVATPTPSANRAQRCLLAGLGGVGLMVLLTLVIAVGLLVIETHTASAYQPPPTFAAALLDAASATGGGGLTAGVFATVTHRNLSRGIQQPADVYQYGLAWLMVAMLAGRLVPLFVLSQAAR